MNTRIRTLIVVAIAFGLLTCRAAEVEKTPTTNPTPSRAETPPAPAAPVSGTPSLATPKTTPTPPVSPTPTPPTTTTAPATTPVPITTTASTQTPQPLPQVTVDELKQKLDSRDDIFLLDVRTTIDFTKGHIGGAVSIPLKLLPDRYREIPESSEVIVYAACA